MLYHAGDSRYTQNSQVNKVIGENEKRVFYGKNHMDIWPTQYYHHWGNITDTCETLLLFSVDHQSRVPDSYNSNVELTLFQRKPTPQHTSIREHFVSLNWGQYGHLQSV